MPRQIEKQSVEDYMIEKLKEKGWKFIEAKELRRESYEEPLFVDNLIEAIKKINKNIDFDEEDIKKILNELRLRGTGQEGLKQILNFLKKGISIKIEKTKDLVRVNLFDYENMENNEFIITKQIIFHTANDEIRADIMLYVNGIPLVIIECKNPAELSVSWEDAYKQIKNYEQTLLELFKYIQIGVAAELIAKYFPIVPWQEEVKIYEWKDEEKKKEIEIGKDISMTSIIEMLSPSTLLDIIKNYLFFREERGEKTKVITRYMQYRASEKIIKRVIENIKGKDTKNKGLIWHWQGSGKTLTMIFAANKLYYLKELENPTIFFILDRQELEEQLFQEFNALDLVRIEKIYSINKLKEVLKHDGGRGKRGFFTVLVHKFRQEELRGFEKELERLSKENETILDRKNIIGFVDEGHRTQYGLLAAQMKNILRNSYFFAFTGTPISKKYKNTYDEFAYPPQEPYLDKYFFTESVNDGFTVKIAYQPRLEDAEGIHLKKDMLETFLKVEYDELPEKIREKIKESVKKKLNATKTYLENPRRITQIAKNIVEHFKEEIEGKFKAMVVAVNRKSCVLYKRELDKLLPKEDSEIVMTFNPNAPHEPQEVISYYEELVKRYPNKELDDIRKEIVDKFKEEENPKILIVTDMLLTGFDSPILQTMYLDKPLKEHRLLQAIARTNRPYKDIKEAGLIIDYLGILKEFKRAFDIYNKKEFEGVLLNREEIRNEFEKLIKDTLEILEDTKKNDFSRENILKSIELLSSAPEKAKLFIKNYKDLRKKFELLGSDVYKTKYADDFKWLSIIYISYLRETNQKEDFEEENYLKRYFSKTLKYIHETTEIEDLKKNLPIINFDEEYIKKLEEKFITKEEKAANIIFTLNRYILVEQQKNPIYESLIGKVERIINLWKEKTKDFEKIYKDGISIIKEANQIAERKKNLGLNTFEYSSLMFLENSIERKAELLEDIKELSEDLKKNIFTNWEFQTIARKKVEREIRAFLIKNKKKYDIDLNKIDELSNKILNNLEKYGTRE